jgi:ATP-dependent Clp protease ATP-binding subunit ClpC
MRPTCPEPDLLLLRRLAEELAQTRKERATSGHLLAAIASHPSQAAELLLERKLGAEILLKAARATTDDEPEPLAHAISRAREMASRMGTSGAGAMHLLLALIQDRKNGAHRALAQCGVDVARLRAAAMQLALGRVGPRRRSPERPAEGQAQATQRGATAARAAGVAVPLVPRSPPKVPSPISALPPPAVVIAPALAKVVVSPAPAPPSAAVAEPVMPAPRKRSRIAASSRFSLDAKLYPTLTSLGKNLTLAAAEEKLDGVVGRDEEIDRVLDILAKRRAHNPLLVGPAGVGKTSVVHGIAQRIARWGGVSSLDDRIIVEVSLSGLLSGTHVRGSLSERIAAVRNEVANAAGRVVLLFEEIHALFAPDLADEVQGELRTALAAGEFSCIGTTTVEEYKRSIEPDPVLSRRFSVVDVEEPTQELACEILAGSTSSLASYHGIGYEAEALVDAVAWSTRYLPGRALPDKALSILDLAGARAKRRGAPSVVRESVAEVVAELADLPVERLLETDRERMLALESVLGDRVVGHKSALARIANVLRRNAAGFRGGRPIGTFLLLGPTGVGKTETAKAIAHALFQSESAMTRLDMAEYAEPHAVARLVGAPPGYIGHDAGGQLTSAVRRRPYQVVLLDEIEKAHQDVLEAFLGVFDEGRLTDGRGKTVDFTNAVIILTSNLGASEMAPRATKSIGFGKGAAKSAAAVEDGFVAAARAALPPELYNRIDEVIAFAPLERVEVAEIAKRMLGALGRTLTGARGIHLDIDDDAVEALLSAGGFDPELGARPMKRTIARFVEAPLAEMILRKELVEGDVARLTVDADEIVIDVVKGHIAAPCRSTPSMDSGNFDVRTS